MDYFVLVSLEEQGNKLIIQLDEKNSKPIEHKDKQLESKGFLPAHQLEDFPIREHKVVLRIRRRKWIDTQTGKSYTNSFNLSAIGTSYTQQFGSFLKRSGWTLPPLVQVAWQTIME